MWRYTGVGIGLLFLTLNVNGSTAVTLEDCYRAAVQKSETISVREQQVLQSREQESQAFGGLLPNLSASANYLIQQSTSNPIFQDFFPSTQPTVKLTLTQPLFRGLREFSTLRQLGHLTDAQRHEKEAALIQLSSEVAQSYFGLLTLEQNIESLKTQLSLYDNRILDLQKRVRSGQSNASEILTAQTARATSKAKLKEFEGQYRSKWEVFTYLTGFLSSTKLKPASVSFDEKTSLLDYLKALETRPDIFAEKERLEAAEDSVSIAKGGHLPTADFVGNYYLVRPIGAYRDINWDVQATLTFSIFSGGAVKAKVNEAASRRVQAELELSKTRRLAEQEIRSLYQSYHSELEQIQALEESMKLSEQNYRVLKSDYSKGLTRNIDVLQALSQYQENKMALNRARWLAQADLTRLRLISNIQPPNHLRN